LTKITAIIIMSLAALAAIFCLLFKIKINPNLYDRRSLKAKFLVAISIMMAFFAGFFTSCKTNEQAIAGNTTPTELSVSEPTPEHVSTPAMSPTVKSNRTPFITCYLVGPLDTPVVEPNVPLPTCYTVVPSVTPSNKNNDIPLVTCYKPAVLSTPANSPTEIMPLCYESVIVPTQTPAGTPSRPTCYAPVPNPTSYKSDSEILDSKLALLEEISKKNTVKEDILNRVKKNMLNQKYDF